MGAISILAKFSDEDLKEKPIYNKQHPISAS
jgi:hypothetical protein